MKMATYIFRILKSHLMVMFSWGLECPVALPNGLKFKVNGFKYVGWVVVEYDEGADLFDIYLPQLNKRVEGIFVGQLIEAIDELVEKTPNYKEKVIEKYKLVGIH